MCKSEVFCREESDLVVSLREEAAVLWPAMREPKNTTKKVKRDCR
jgi:hypothetical protein